MLLTHRFLVKIAKRLSVFSCVWLFLSTSLIASAAGATPGTATPDQLVTAGNNFYFMFVAVMIILLLLQLLIVVLLLLIF